MAAYEAAAAAARTRGGGRRSLQHCPATLAQRLAAPVVPATCPTCSLDCCPARFIVRPQSRPLGRGPGTGKGKTSGRGHKGRRARSGGSVRLGFEGGQTPLYLRLPKFGFNRKDLQEPLEELTLGRLQLLIDQGRIDASKRITIADIAKSGAVSRVRHGIKVLATVRWCMARAFLGCMCARRGIADGLKNIAKPRCLVAPDRDAPAEGLSFFWGGE